jgi:hypothetical protein
VSIWMKYAYFWLLAWFVLYLWVDVCMYICDVPSLF